MYDNYNLCTKEKQNAYLFAINKIPDENTSIACSWNLCISILRSIKITSVGIKM